MLRHVEVMPRVSMKRLHEGRIDVDNSARTKNSAQLSRGLMRIGKMLEYGLAHNRIEGLIAKGKPGLGTDDIRPPILNGIDIHHVRSQLLLRGMTGSEIQDETVFLTIENFENVRRIGIGRGLFRKVKAGRSTVMEKVRDLPAEARSA
jgi:hypothetical protein